ncbi:type II toxin-antitoxin system RelE/ParE family toxin [Frankia sp. Cas4]|uniref:type II toxin-antitoxin system RelE family toxin n=1 Tax=Frankia sp. Cas4 TaxID=3073927 RepID=UPI002AD45EE4|nr:type II toxin-antitoxin system RelE/ParE family toxin [Frankia sp. Cas4]
MAGGESYKVEIDPHAQHAFRKLSRDVQNRLTKVILALEHTPRPVGCKAVVGQPGYWRIQVGDYRVIYTVWDDVLVVLVVELGHRRDVYRR